MVEASVDGAITHLDGKALTEQVICNEPDQSDGNRTGRKWRHGSLPFNSLLHGIFAI